MIDTNKSPNEFYDSKTPWSRDIRKQCIFFDFIVLKNAL
jgi:hypothetical protein